MKWRECSESKRHEYFQGPEESYYVARKSGRTYEVNASWRDRSRREGDVLWWSYDGEGTNKAWKSKEAAMAWCERHAATTPAKGKAPTTEEG